VTPDRLKNKILSWSQQVKKCSTLPSSFNLRRCFAWLPFALFDVVNGIRLITLPGASKIMGASVGN
jgi:hypothetical protein